MGRFSRQGERRGCGSEVFARERSGAGGRASGVAFPMLESSILQSTNGFPWQAILLPVGQGYSAMSGDMFACHRLGKEKGGALGSCVCVWEGHPHRIGWLAPNAVGQVGPPALTTVGGLQPGARRVGRADADPQCMAGSRGSAVRFWDRDSECSDEVGRSGRALQTTARLAGRGEGRPGCRLPEVCLPPGA